jgi:WhiB family redox-sensing transcriptional regulator
MMEGALCAQIGGDLWFADKGQADDYAEAKKICLRCPIRLQCLEFALDNDERYGVWGGLSWTERRDEARKRRNGRQRRSQPQERPFGEHGTTAGCKRHYLRGEKPCVACRTAYNWARNERRRKPA